jgi:hypothetical protein
MKVHTGKGTGSTKYETYDRPPDDIINPGPPKGVDIQVTFTIAIAFHGYFSSAVFLGFLLLDSRFCNVSQRLKRSRKRWKGKN